MESNVIKKIQHTVRVHPVIRKMRAWSVSLQHNFNRPFVLRLYYMDIITAVLLACAGSNYFFLMTKYRSSLVKVLNLNAWWQAAYVFTVTFLILNIFGNIHQNCKAYFVQRLQRPPPAQRETRRQVFMNCFKSLHKRHNILYLFYSAVLAAFINICTYYYHYVKVDGFSVSNELLRFVLKGHYFYESFVDRPERKLEPYVLIFPITTSLVIASTALLCTRIYMIILRENLDVYNLKGCIQSFFGVNWCRAILWPFADSPEPKDVHEKDS